jgi:tRNA G10  N-methylase Trm11
VVLDAFCGCGTTMEAAQSLGRKWIGIDISQTAIHVVENRLRKMGAPPPELHGMVQTEDELRHLSWQEFQAWAVDAVQGRHSPQKAADMGIDGFTFMEHHPIQVKQMDAVGRPIIDNFVGVLKRQRDKRGLIIAFSFSKGALGEVARLKREDELEIELITCRHLIHDEIPYRTLA